MSELKAEALIKALGYDPEKIKTEEDFKNFVNTDFIRRDNVHNDDEITNKIVGKNLQQIEKAMLSHIKDLGVEMTDEDFKEAKNTYDKIKIGMSKVKAFHETSTNELKGLAEKKGGEAAKEWQEKYAKADARALENETAVKTLRTQLDEKEKWAKDQVKNYRIEDARKSAFGKVTFKDGLTDLERTGFETIFNSKYVIDLDDKEQPIIYEKGTNKRIDNKAVVGTFLNVEDVLKMEIELNKLGKTNPHAGSGTVVKPDPFNPIPQGGAVKKGLPISDAFFNNKK